MKQEIGRISKYDFVVLGDVNITEMNKKDPEVWDSFENAVVDLVENGGGFGLVCGYFALREEKFLNSELNKLLPFKFTWKRAKKPYWERARFDSKKIQLVDSSFFSMGYDFDEIGTFRGYTGTSRSDEEIPGAETILSFNSEPLLAVRKIEPNRGRSFCFLSDWGEWYGLDFEKWPRFFDFWAEIFRWIGRK